MELMSNKVKTIDFLRRLWKQYLYPKEPGFCSNFDGHFRIFLCYPRNCMHNLHASYGPILYIWQCVVITFCSIFEWYFVCVLFCLSFCVQINRCLSACLPLSLLICAVWSALCLVTVAVICTLCSQPMLGWLYQGRNLGTDQIWQSYEEIHDILQLLCRGISQCHLVGKNPCWQGFVEVCNTLYIMQIIKFFLKHFYYKTEKEISPSRIRTWCLSFARWVP